MFLFSWMDDIRGAKGRGAVSNSAGRYEAYRAEPVDDGWYQDDVPPLKTNVSIERPRSVITRNASPDLSFDRSINPYRGCEHGCVYCFARPSHAWLGLSPGLDFETELVARPEAPQVLERELARKTYRPDVIAIGTNTDPYQPIEKEYRIMRGILEVLEAHQHPVTVTTKGTLIERDIDILARMAERGLARVGFSVTTLDPAVSRAMEPRVPNPARRLETIRRLTGAGIPVRVMVSPVIPALTDHEMEAIMSAAADAGADSASWVMLRLPLEVSPIFRAWVTQAFPDRAGRIMGRVRELHGGKDYVADWGRRMRGEGPFADLMAHRFKVAQRRLGLAEHTPALRRDLFKVPPRAGDQLSLF
ncbi:MAG: PA0069 family radical SAM protein [Pseudomonadota bacterium]